MRSIVLTILISLAASSAFAQNPFKAIKPGQTIKLKAGAVVQLEGNVYIPSGVTITTDATNPATLVMDPSVVYGLCVQGRDITIENIVLDFNMQGEWRPFRAPISFKLPAFRNRLPDAPIENVTIDHVTFINSTPSKTRPGKGDSWAVSFANNSPEPLHNIVVKNCRQLAKKIQLTANGNGHGISGLRILDNYCEYGHANSIAVSSGVEGGLFENILIARNELRQCTGIGIFVGVDGGKGLPSLDLQNIYIVQNHIEMAAESPKYAMAILVRSNGDCKEIDVLRNTIDTTRKAKNSWPRWFSLQGQEQFETTYRFKDNTLLGRGTNIVRHATELN